MEQEIILKKSLTLSGAMNAEIYDRMSEEEVNAFIVQNAEESMRRRMELHTEEGWTKSVKIKSTFIVMDKFLTPVKRVRCVLSFARKKGAVLVTKSVTSLKRKFK